VQPDQIAEGLAVSPLSQSDQVLLRCLLFQ
jgi:hypothetical protein